MSLDYTTYLGPYLQCTTTKTDKVVSRRTGTNSKCANQNGFMHSKFCYQCGSPIDDVEFTVKANKVNECDLRDKIKDVLVPPGGEYFYEMSRDKNIDIWLANRNRPDKESRIFSFDSREADQYMVIGAGVVKFEIDEFVSQYKNEIAIIEQEYGKENVSVNWGLVHYIC